MDFYDVIKQRRSIRGFSDRPVEKEKLERILGAARTAPTAANRQPFRIVVCESADKRQMLKRAYSPDWFWKAPVIICVATCPEEAWTRKDGKNYADVDGTIAMDHIVLAATAEGLATCWIGAFDPEAARQVLELPEGQQPLAMTPLGYPAAEPGATSRRSLEELVRRL